QHHFDNECPFTLIDCWFKPFGCNHKCHKQILNHHLISNMKFHFNLVMQLFQSMKQTIQLHQVQFLFISFLFDNSNKLTLEIETLKKDLNSRIKNLRKETFKYHSDIETIKKDFNHQQEQLKTTVKSLEEKNSKLKRKYQRLKAKLCDQEKIEKKEEHQNNIGISSSSNINFDQFCSSSKLLKTFNGHTGHVLSIDYSTFDDNQFLCSGSSDKTIRVWDIKTNKQIQLFNEYSDFVYCVKFSPYHYHNHRQNVICSSSFDKTIRFWDFKHNKQLQIFNEHSRGVNGIEFSPFNGGRYLCSGSGDTTIRLWDVETSKSLHVFNGHTGTVRCVDISPLQSNKSKKSNSIGVIGGNGYTICSGSRDKTIRIWDIETSKQSIILNGHENWITSVKYGSNELRNTILSGSFDKSVRLWDIRCDRQIQVFNRHISVVHAVEYSPFVVKSDGEVSDSSNVICSGSFDNTIRFWDIRSNKNELYVIKEHGPIYCLTFLPLKKEENNSKNPTNNDFHFHLCYGPLNGLICVWG
ncbi:hypothetical protein RFI_22124, partial [Reticulomyxa filosa]